MVYLHGDQYGYKCRFCDGYWMMEILRQPMNSLLRPLDDGNITTDYFVHYVVAVYLHGDQYNCKYRFCNGPYTDGNVTTHNFEQHAVAVQNKIVSPLVPCFLVIPPPAVMLIKPSLPQTSTNINNKTDNVVNAIKSFGFAVALSTWRLMQALTRSSRRWTSCDRITLQPLTL